MILTVARYVNEGLRCFIPYTANVHDTKANIAIGVKLNITKFKKTVIILFIFVSVFLLLIFDLLAC